MPTVTPTTVLMPEPQTDPWRVDPRYVTLDPVTERPMFVFACQYTFAENELWEFRVWAYDFDDAAARLKAIRSSAKLLGQVMKDELNEL